ncbi:Do family serine endopeptidase [bacterium SCSIO 12741]|nr:Do family serine endopeptidase [bacterium SCSIO 12741]
MKQTWKTFLSALLGGAIALSGYHFVAKPEPVQQAVVVQQETVPAQLVRNPGVPNPLPDLTFAAEKSLESVVHVRTVYSGQEYYQSNPLFDLFYGRPRYNPQPEGTGSGVIISDDGYIVTNNHVVEGAENVKITLHDKQVFEAEVIGRDPSTDLALLKVDAENLPYLSYGNSDMLKVGEWVLAVGNPFNLNSTVTAGIISAKGRDINILTTNDPNGSSAVEAFIQTDAAVNPGNSGGALVNAQGELIGINAAIKSNTGSFMGYSFAIPANITRKVVKDLMEFGSVQRAFIGVSIRNITPELAEREKLKTRDGIYVAGLAEKGSAREAGIEAGDVITHINSRQVNDVPELQEQLSNFRPGDKVKVTLIRDNESIEIPLVLRNKFGNTDIIDRKDEGIRTVLGANFEEITEKQKSRLGISSGVQVIDLQSGKLMKAGVREGFIILRIDGQRIGSYQDLSNALDNKKGGVLVEGIYPNGRAAYYGIGM